MNKIPPVPLKRGKTGHDPHRGRVSGLTLVRDRQTALGAFGGRKMKIAISAMEPGLDSDLDPRFGRSRYFLLVEPETMQVETLINPNQEESSGAGIGTAQLICSKGVGTVITGRIGPKAHQVLSAAGVRMLTGVSGKVGDAVRRFKEGKLAGETDLGANQVMRPGSGMGRGMRAGGGKGRGMGRGMGCGAGRGMGMRAGRGGGAGQFRDINDEPRFGGEIESNAQDELALLKRQADMLAAELAGIRRRIDEFESS